MYLKTFCKEMRVLLCFWSDQLVLQNQIFFNFFLKLSVLMHFIGCIFCFTDSIELPNCQHMTWFLWIAMSQFPCFRTMNWMGLIRQKLILKTIRSAWMSLRRYFYGSTFLSFMCYLLFRRWLESLAQSSLIWLCFVYFFIFAVWAFLAPFGVRFVLKKMKKAFACIHFYSLLYSLSFWW